MSRKKVKEPRSDSLSEFDDFEESWRELEAGFRKTPGRSAADTHHAFDREQRQARTEFRMESRRTQNRYESESEGHHESFEVFREGLAPFAQKLENEQVDLEDAGKRVRARTGVLPSGAIVDSVTSSAAQQMMIAGRDGLDQVESDFQQKQYANRTIMAAKKRRSFSEV